MFQSKPHHHIPVDQNRSLAVRRDLDHGKGAASDTLHVMIGNDDLANFNRSIISVPPVSSLLELLGIARPQRLPKRLSDVSWILLHFPL